MEKFLFTIPGNAWILAIFLFTFFSCTADTFPHHEIVNGDMIYDYDINTLIGDEIYGTIICNFEQTNPGRNSHGGPVALEYSNGDLVAFHTNTNKHSIDGWTEYAISKDRGQSWKMNNKLMYSYNAYSLNPERPAWVEQGLVTKQGTIVLFITHFNEKGLRANCGFIRSMNNGRSWTQYQPLDGSFAGYCTATEVDDTCNYLLIDSSDNGPHVLYVSTNDGKSWHHRSTLSLENEKWYGAMCVMKDGGILAGAYDMKEENYFSYCISKDKGYTWTEQKQAFIDKKVRDPELAFCGGKYYLHGRSGNKGKGKHRFVLYQSKDGENWNEGIIISSHAYGPDGYSDNCIINRFNYDKPEELMVVYSILYEPIEDKSTNEYVFFVKPGP